MRKVQRHLRHTDLLRTDWIQTLQRTRSHSSEHVHSNSTSQTAVASELWGQGVHCTPKFRTFTPCTPQVKYAAYVKILSKRL